MSETNGKLPYDPELMKARQARLHQYLYRMAQGSADELMVGDVINMRREYAELPRIGEVAKIMEHITHYLNRARLLGYDVDSEGSDGNGAVP